MRKSDLGKNRLLLRLRTSGSHNCNMFLLTSDINSLQEVSGSNSYGGSSVG